MKKTTTTWLALFLCSSVAFGFDDPPSGGSGNDDCVGCEGDLQIVSQKSVPGYKIKVEFHDESDPEYDPSGSCKEDAEGICSMDDPCNWMIRYTYTIGPGKTADLKFCTQELSPEEGEESCVDVADDLPPGTHVSNENPGGAQCGSIRKDTLKLGPSETVYYLICTSCKPATGSF